LHYGSSCFEGLKAHRNQEGAVGVFRLDSHVARLRGSADALCLPVPPMGMVQRMVTDVVHACLDQVPDPPGSLYLRPTLIGSEANIGAASRPAREALLFVLASPVGDYLSAGGRALVLAIETQQPRTTPQFGKVKTGANYAMALGVTIKAAEQASADQVLFAPGGDIQETGASNFLVINDNTIITPARGSAFLNGVTLDSLLALGSDLGYRVEERTLTVDEVLTLAAHPGCEAALSGTAAVLAGVGTLVHRGATTRVGCGAVGPHTRRLRRALTDIQAGRSPDRRRWLTTVSTSSARRSSTA
jgi:branched-chain amino acid aminotransferase